ncbi:ferredoxin--NADP reductase [Persicitalea jodogahamensis]|uniref:3-ketosteroid-9-alpha-hydroxylase reductase subunit n=1 Tax=Persicitalea jodogahamensis TaxID=402147 RepID=A0A8J3G913_9BACT|nr:ferredoxin--NADP reductase [Persicitalea jodogahamensis]GHB70939.1 3-ketosteroid-9-alpha-hydroxylase reductase subunit [Persicitalea jodogahamensis]
MQENVLPLRVKNIISETHDTRTFVLEPTDGDPLKYLPGQFLTFLLKIENHEVRRSYSMSSAPGIDALPAITIKRVANGEVSRYWHDRVQVGTLLHALPPAGRFTLDDSAGEPRDIFLLAAGSGITPLFSIMKYALTHESDCRVTLLYASRRGRSIIFNEQLEEWQARYPERLEIIHILSQPTDDWPGRRGRINNYRLENIVRKRLHFPTGRARFFLCGPFELMRIAEITLLFMGMAPAQIRKENFVIDTVPQPPKKSEPHTIRLNFHGDERELEVPAYTSILQASLNNGIPIPYSCKGGRCGTCAAICRTGEVRMSLNDVLTERDLAQGWVLTCTGYVESEGVVLEVV